jgi:outer membrane biosynthesis protein TonB
MRTYFTRRNLLFAGLSFLLHFLILISIYDFGFKSRLTPYQKADFALVEADLKKDVQVSKQAPEKMDAPTGRKMKPVVKELVPEVPNPLPIVAEPLKQSPETESRKSAESSPIAASDSVPSGSTNTKAYSLNINNSGKSSDAEAQTGVIDAASNSIKVEKLYAPLPTYPERAVDLDGSGIFEILIIINISGSVSDIKILSTKVSNSSEFLKSIFKDEIFRVVKKWKFKPVKFKNRPVSVAVKCPIEFKQENPDYH